MTLVDTPQGLNSACQALSGAAYLSLDTEFVRERTYYPVLCLIQVASQDQIFCIDAIKLPDLEPLMALIYDTSIVKLLHAGRQDLEIFYLLRSELPAPLFDTQAAAPFAGLGEQLGYAQLVHSILGVELAKAHTRADWSRRPLSAAELNYAADDVRYLSDIYQWLRSELIARGRLQWLEEEMLAFQQPTLYTVEPQDAWRRVKGGQRVDAKTLARVRALAAWRETEARRRDLPRLWVLRDNGLLEIARRRPSDLNELGDLEGLPKGIVKKHGSALLASIQEVADEPTDEGSDQNAYKPDPAKAAAVEAVLALVKRYAEREALVPSVIASRRQVEALCRHPQDSPLLRGWRKTLLGEELVTVLNEKLGLAPGSTEGLLQGSTQGLVPESNQELDFKV
jgi:ribonuclease D